MTFQIPVINLEFGEVKDIIWTKLQEPHYQRKLILVIVSTALLLDNMLYMVIVPIIPDYLRYIGAYGPPEVKPIGPPTKTGSNITIREPTPPPGAPVKYDHHGQDTSTGVLFASKAIVQLMVNPFSGALIDKIGYDIPMMIGLTIMFLSTAVFACGRSYGLLFFARSLQGVGSAFADTSGLAMIADRFTEEAERSKALGIALAFISFGCLVAPPFGGALYQFAGKEVPFLILAFVSLADGFMLLLVMKPLKTIIKEAKVESAASTPIWRLLMDPYIAVCAGALMMSNVALAFLEPTISLWMEDNLTTDNWKIGMIWLPAFFPHVFGVIVTVKMAKRYPQWQWAMAAGGLALEGLCCFIIPFSSSYKVLMLPICGICFGIALIDTALLPTLGYLVDVRYVSVYGSIYAIADISYSVAYAVGPIIAGGVVEAIGFTALNFLIAFSNLLYAPVLMYLKNIYDFKPFQNEANILMSDPPPKEYQTYSMQDQKPVDGDYKNHLEYGRYQDTEGNYAETALDGKFADGATNEYQGYQYGDGSYQQQGSSSYQQYQGAESNYNYSSGQPSYEQQGQYPSYQGGQQYFQQETREEVNPFRQQTSGTGGDKNPFRGWRETLISLPKRILSGVSFSSESEDPDQNQVLPKLPVPSLENTMEKYLRAVEPLVSESQLQNTKGLVEHFVSSEGQGQKLQNMLLQRREEKDNWAYEWWLNDMYMNVQLPLPINSNPGMVFPPRQFGDLKAMARFSAILISGILDHKEKLDRKALPLERATSRDKGQPLCMAQYYRLLTSYRVPGATRDQLFSTLYQGDGSTELIIVIHKNQPKICDSHAMDSHWLFVETPNDTLIGKFPQHVLSKLSRAVVDLGAPLYSLIVKTRRADNTELKLNVNQIAGELLKILEAPRTIRAIPVGLLTTQKRDIWAAARETLKLEYQNVDNLEMVEKCLVVLCLDEPLPESFNMPSPRGEKREVSTGFKCGDRDETNMMHQMISGGGSLYNSANRWFDKTIQLIISKDGVCGLCYEHSPAEGIPVIQLVEDLLALADNALKEEQETNLEPAPEDMTANKLEWVINAETQKNILDAAKAMDNLVEDLDFYVYRYKNYGKEFIKSCNCSPDAYLQMALQLAYYKLYGHLVATYESAGTRRFLLGRVDCIRSATSETLKWIQSMAEGGEEGEISKKVTFSLVDDSKRLELFDAAMKRQTEIMVDNILGEGIDIHLLGLREMAAEAKEETPAIFKDETYITANHFSLSTSQLATKSDLFMGYGPVVPDGYGASYNPRKEEIVFCLSAWHSCAKTSTWRFARSLGEALDSMQKLLKNREIDLK